MSDEGLSVAQLERMLNAKKSEIDSLTRERERLSQQLHEVDEKIRALTGRRGGGAVPGRERPKNDMSLHDTIVDILGRYKRGLPLAELVEKVLESGYKTNSGNFRNVAYQCLYNATDIQHDAETGRYKIVTE